MNNPLKFDIKLSFTSKILQNNKDDIDLSTFFDNLLNKKINIHLKINLDKIQQQFQKRKSYFSQQNSQNNSFDDIIINNSFEENSDDSVIELEKEITPVLKYNSNKNINSSIYRNISNRKNSMIKNKIKSTLVLDLDETLVYVTDMKNDDLPIMQIPFEYYVYDDSELYIKKNMKIQGYQNMEKATNYLIIRPGFNKFISEVKKYFDEIFIFTSSQYSYAEEIVKIIDKNKYISKIYSRKDCSFYNEVFYKDLNKIKKDLSNTIIIDNFPESYLLQHFNGLPIPSFMGDPNDNELIKLLPILEKLSKVKDVRNYIREIVNPEGVSILFNKAYELLKINKEEKNMNKKSISLIKNKNGIKRYGNILSNVKINNTWKKSNLKISELIDKSNNQTIDNDSNNEKIIVNDTNNYFYIEKDVSPISTMVPSSNIKKKIKKKISSNPSDANSINNKKTKKKNLILECLYNNKQYNNQLPQLTKPIMLNKSINLNNYNMNENSLNEAGPQNTIIYSSKHSKSKSLISNDSDLFENKPTNRNVNSSRNLNEYHHNLSYKNFRIFSLKNN